MKAQRLIRYIKEQVNSIIFKYEHKTDPQHFTRESPLDFVNTTFLILRLIKRSTKVEIMNFFYELGDKILSPSRQAFAQAREKISYLVFKDFFDKSCALAVLDEEAAAFKGFRIFAADGTSFVVGDWKKLHSFFGETTTVEGSSICRIGGMVDVINNCIVSALVAPFSSGERTLALTQIQTLSGVANALFLFDRGYWSPDIVKNIIGQGQRFLMRLPSNAIRSITKDGSGHVQTGGGQLRYYAFTLPGGSREILVTNLTENEMSDQGLAELYAMRWGIETKYLELKLRLQLDYLSGSSVNIVLQDIYSTLLISNMVAFVCSEADKEIARNTEDKANLHPSIANRSVCIAALRSRFVCIFLLKDPEEVDIAIDRFYKEIARCVTYKGKSKARLRGKHKRENPYKARPLSFL